MSQPSLFDWTPPVASPSASEQGQQIARVAGTLAPLVFEWCRVRVGETWTADDLRRFVQQRAGAAAGSPDRILRLLRQHGFIAYRVTNRRASQYVVDWTRREEP